jgi:hypothetical protein
LRRGGGRGGGGWRGEGQFLAHAPPRRGLQLGANLLFEHPIVGQERRLLMLGHPTPLQRVLLMPYIALGENVAAQSWSVFIIIR